jgi:integrase/recombinase XerD
MKANPLAQLVDDFVRHLTVDKHSAPNTVSAYRNDLNQFERFVSDQTKDDAPESAAEGLVRLETVAAFVLALRERGYSAATIARRLAAVKSLFAYAHAAGLIDKNPAAALDSPRVIRPERKEVTAGQVAALLEGCAGETAEAARNRAMLTLLYETGLRVSEVVGLDVSDVDFSTSTITARGRTGKERSVPLPASAAVAMETYVSGPRNLLRRDASESALFLNGRGGRLTRQGFWLIITTRARESGLGTPVSPHALRNSFARDRLASGTALTDLKELLGHVSISTTRAYARNNGGKVAQPVKA